MQRKRNRRSNPQKLLKYEEESIERKVAMNEKQVKILHLLHQAYNDIVEEDPAFAKVLLRSYQQIEMGDVYYKIVCARLVGSIFNYIRQHHYQVPSSILKLNIEISAIAQRYQAWSVAGIWFS